MGKKAKVCDLGDGAILSFIARNGGAVTLTEMTREYRENAHMAKSVLFELRDRGAVRKVVTPVVDENGKGKTPKTTWVIADGQAPPAPMPAPIGDGVTHDSVLEFIEANDGKADLKDIRDRFGAKRYFAAKGAAITLSRLGKLRRCSVKGARKPKVVFALPGVDVEGETEVKSRARTSPKQLSLEWSKAGEQALLEIIQRRGGRTSLHDVTDSARHLVAVERSGATVRELLERLVADGKLVETIERAARCFTLASALRDKVEGQRPTSMTHLEFMRRFDEIRKRVGVLGIIEMQGLTGIVLDEDIELARNDNPTLAQAIEIAHILANERMIRVLPYQLRYGGKLSDEIEQLTSCQAVTGTSSPTKVYARLAALGYSTTLAEVRKVMGFPEFERGNPEP